MEDLGKVAGMRWAIEGCLKGTNRRVGMGRKRGSCGMAGAGILTGDAIPPLSGSS